MKWIKPTLFLLLCLTGYPSKSFSQDSNNYEFTFTENIENLLPPLEILIDSAIANNPNVEFRVLQIKVNEYKLKSDRLQWLRNVGIQTDIRYGTFDNFSTNTAEGQNPSIISTRETQLNYGMGAYVKLPLYDFANRKNQINLSKTEVEQAQSMVEVQRNEIRQLVIRQYNDLVLKQKLLKIKSKYLETSRINMEMVEKEFQNGVVSIGEYSRISDLATRAESDFEISRVDYITGYMILEEIVGFKFNLNESN